MHSIDTNVSLRQGYFRFGDRRHGGHCYIFVVLASSFRQVAESVAASGFGTSLNVLFMLCLTRYNMQSLNEGFSDIKNRLDVETFRAPIVFYVYGATELGELCYFCPHKRFVLYTEKLSVGQLLKISNQTNSNGYGFTAITTTIASIPPELIDILTRLFELKCQVSDGLRQLMYRLKQHIIMPELLVSKLLLGVHNATSTMHQCIHAESGCKNLSPE